jgi:hypothetical protein
LVALDGFLEDAEVPPDYALDQGKVLGVVGVHAHPAEEDFAGDQVAHYQLLLAGSVN